MTLTSIWSEIRNFRDPTSNPKLPTSKVPRSETSEIRLPRSETSDLESSEIRNFRPRKFPTEIRLPRFDFRAPKLPRPETSEIDFRDPTSDFRNFRDPKLPRSTSEIDFRDSTSENRNFRPRNFRDRLPRSTSEIDFRELPRSSKLPTSKVPDPKSKLSDLESSGSRTSDLGLRISDFGSRIRNFRSRNFRPRNFHPWNFQNSWIFPSRKKKVRKNLGVTIYKNIIFFEFINFMELKLGNKHSTIEIPIFMQCYLFVSIFVKMFHLCFT